MNVDAKPKDKAIVSLVETKMVSRLTRLRAGMGRTHFGIMPLVQKFVIEVIQWRKIS
jgi:hypothetical protein